MSMDELENVFDDDLELDVVVPEAPIPDDAIYSNDENIFESTPEKESQEELSIIDEFLSLNGISNGTIKFIDEDNKETEKNFYELTKEEQLEVLNSFMQNPEQADTPEQQFLQYLKGNNLSVNDFLAKYKDEVVKELTAQYEPNYEIDAYDDEELFLLDLKSKYDLTDEELKAELEKELQNDVLFKKKVDSLRSEYKKLEDQYKENQQAEFNKQREEEYNKFADTIVDIAVKNSEFYGIELEDSEKNEVLSFLLDLDDNGASEFYKELNKPDRLYEAAWFLKYGKSAFDALRSAYESEIAKIKKDNTRQVVIKKDNQKNPNSIHELF